MCYILKLDFYVKILVVHMFYFLYFYICWILEFFEDFNLLVGPICNNFEKNPAFYDKSMKLGTWLVDNKTKKLRVSATPKMSSNGRHLVFLKWPPFSTNSF